ncbi:class I adenylate-forming enzyme family protein [Microvirga subterranea]|uniref:Long-chain acyl-CoA synthetase n=1 Tax=Microvirga subterranea TaxID=186651 RepID=A0A370HBC7_9HYPH|nr:AMP-binding protein [Microvirga subterranea]RDI53811.1 long-chain acyl-CoA synthetase [Microvirga subterranea]
MHILSHVLARNVQLAPDRDFIISESETLTYREFGERTARLANVLAQHGIGKGDRVGLYLPSTPLMAVAFWACQRLGAIPTPLSAMFRHSELRRIVARTKMNAIIADTETWGYFSEIRGEFPELGTCLVQGGGQGADPLEALMDIAEPSFADIACDHRDVACLFFTSGTTGTPKGIAQTHFSVLSTLRDMMVSHRTRFGEEVYLCAVPLFTNFGLTVTLNLCLYTGGTIVLHDRWDTERVMTDIGRYRATYFGGTPTMYVYMVNSHEPARHDLSSLRICTTGGSPVPQPVIKRFEELSGVKVAQVYGATETCGQNVIEPTLGVRKAGSAGLPVGSSRIAILDDKDNELPRGAIGEVIIGGDCIAQGYWGDPDATAAAFGSLGWRSGDLGYVDEDGFLFIVDRKKDLIIAGGHNIYPLEVESVLYCHPAVAMCAVVGAPDVEKGEIPVAVVVLDEDAVVTPQELREWCRKDLAAYKVPRRIEIIHHMPVEAAKIRKRDLVEALKGEGLDKYRRQ